MNNKMEIIMNNSIITSVRPVVAPVDAPTLDHYDGSVYRIRYTDLLETLTVILNDAHDSRIDPAHDLDPRWSHYADVFAGDRALLIDVVKNSPGDWSIREYLTVPTDEVETDIANGDYAVWNPRCPIEGFHVVHPVDFTTLYTYLVRTEAYYNDIDADPTL